MKIILLLILTLLSAGCAENTNEREKGDKWYTQSQVENGRAVFAKNCAICHKIDASGAPNWKETLADGSLPPPPLNGSAHAWHHSLSVLRKYIKEGGAALGGKMPGFNEKLSESEINDAIAYFQSFWSNDIYKLWIDRNGLE